MMDRYIPNALSTLGFAGAHPTQLKHRPEVCSKRDIFLQLPRLEFSELSSADLREQFELENIVKDSAELPTRSLYFSAAADYRAQFDLPIVAITGSAGKSTVKDLLASLLNAAGPTLASEKNFNTKPRIAEKLLELRPNHKFAVFEAGARQYRDLDWPVRMIQPTLALCLNIGRAHLGVFGSQEKLQETKLSIFENNPKLEQAIINIDDPALAEWAGQTELKTLSFGVSQNADIQILQTEQTGSQWHYSFLVGSQKIDFVSGFYHETFASNLAAALAVLYALNLNPLNFTDVISKYRPPEGRFTTYRLKNKTLINDAFNASPEAVEAGLRTLSLAYPNSTKTVLLGDLLELGEDTEMIHECLVRKALELLPSDQVVLTGPVMKKIAHKLAVKHIEKSEILSLLEESRQVVYCKSSKGIGLKDLCDRYIASQGVQL